MTRRRLLCAWLEPAGTLLVGAPTAGDPATIAEEAAAPFRRALAAGRLLHPHPEARVEVRRLGTRAPLATAYIRPQEPRP